VFDGAANGTRSRTRKLAMLLKAQKLALVQRKERLREEEVATC
jgi:hypothetical protein